MRTLPDTLVRGSLDDRPVIVRDDLAVLRDGDVVAFLPRPRLDRAPAPLPAPAPAVAAPGRRRVPVSLAARALRALRQPNVVDLDERRAYAAAGRSAPTLFGSIVTGQRR